MPRSISSIGPQVLALPISSDRPMLTKITLLTDLPRQFFDDRLRSIVFMKFVFGEEIFGCQTAFVSLLFVYLQYASVTW